MKKFLLFILSQLKYFFINSFWRKWPILVVVILSAAANGLIWYLYLGRLSEFVNITPIYFAFGVFILNLFLAAVSYPKEKIISDILLGSGFLIQILILFFLGMSLAFGGF